MHWNKQTEGKAEGETNMVRYPYWSWFWVYVYTFNWVSRFLCLCNLLLYSAHPNSLSTCYTFFAIRTVFNLLYLCIRSHSFCYTILNIIRKHNCVHFIQNASIHVKHLITTVKGSKCNSDRSTFRLLHIADFSFWNVRALHIWSLFLTTTFGWELMQSYLLLYWKSPSMI